MDRLSNEDIIRNIRLIASDKPIDINEKDIDEFLSILSIHKCYYLLSKVKGHLNHEKILLCRAMLAKNNAILREKYTMCKPLFDTLNDLHIPYAVYKGVALSVSAYKSPYYRQSFDIDLLIKKHNIPVVKKALTDMGFVQGKFVDNMVVPYSRSELVFYSSMTHQTAPFILQTESELCPFVNIDINFDIIWGEAQESSDMDYVLNSTEKCNLYGVTISCLSPVVDFISICLHHYKDANSIYQIYDGKLKLCLYMDIYYYLKRNKDSISAEDLIAVCEKLKVSKYVYYCIYHANLIFCDDILAEYVECLHPFSDEALLWKFGLEDSEMRSWIVSFYDRLFDREFINRFSQSLTYKDMGKIRYNSNLGDIIEN